MTCHRFGRFGDLLPKHGRVQRPGKVGRLPAFDGDKSPAESADKSAHSKVIVAMPHWAHPFGLLSHDEPVASVGLLVKFEVRKEELGDEMERGVGGITRIAHELAGARHHAVAGSGDGLERLAQGRVHGGACQGLGPPAAPSRRPARTVSVAGFKAVRLVLHRARREAARQLLPQASTTGSRIFRRAARAFGSTEWRILARFLRVGPSSGRQYPQVLALPTVGATRGTFARPACSLILVVPRTSP